MTESPIHWIDLLLILGATYRLTSTIVEESFPPTSWFRDKVLARLPGEWSSLALCRWCLSMWVGTVFAVTWWLAVDPRGELDQAAWLAPIWYVLTLSLTASAFTGNVADREPPPQ